MSYRNTSGSHSDFVGGRGRKLAWESPRTDALAPLTTLTLQSPLDAQADFIGDVIMGEYDAGGTVFVPPET